MNRLLTVEEFEEDCRLASIDLMARVKNYLAAKKGIYYVNEKESNFIEHDLKVRKG